MAEVQQEFYALICAAKTGFIRMEAPVETKREAFALLADQVASQPKLARLAASLAKNFKSTASGPLQRAKDLAYLLYVQEQPALCLQVCQLLNDITFRHNYNLWTWVELTLALEWKLQVDAGQATQAQACADAIRATYQMGSETEQLQKAKALERRLTGDLLHDAQILDAQQRNDKGEERTYRLLQLGALLFIEALGGSDTLPVPELRRQFARNLAALRSA